MANFFTGIGAVLAAIGVALGAFGAHGLRAKLEPRLLEIWQTGVEYHMYHALGLILLGLLLSWAPSGALINWSGGLMLAGILFFSGSLYLLVLTGLGWLGAITPLGGLSFIIAWLLLAAALFSAN